MTLLPTRLSEESADAGIEAYDVTEIWSGDAPLIDKAGDYALSADVSTDKTLVVAAPKGETVTIDFAGHSARVDGKVDCAIDVSRSLGTVVLTDSTRRDGDKPKSTVALTARGAASAVCAVKANYPQESAGAAPKLSLGFLSLRAELVSADAGAGDAAIDCYGLYAGSGADGEVDVVVSDCTVSAAVLTGVDKLGGDEKAISEDGAGLAAAIFAASPGVTLDGTISATAASPAGACGLYGNQAPAATLGSGFSAEDDLVVYADGNAAGTVALACGDAVAQPQAARIVDATSQGLVAVAAEGGVAFGPAEPAQEAPADDVANSDADGGSAAENSEGDGAETGQDESKPEEVLPAAVSKLRSLMTSAGGISTQSTAAPSADEGAMEMTSSTTWAAGSYYLDSDVAISGKSLTDNTDGEIKIDLRGHTLTVGAANQNGKSITLGSTNLATAGTNLTVYDSTEDRAKRGTVKFVGTGTAGFCLNPGAGTLKLDNINVVKEFANLNTEVLYSRGLIYTEPSTSTNSKPLKSTDSGYDQTRRMRIIVNNCDLIADYSKQTKTANTSGNWNYDPNAGTAAAAISITSYGTLDLLRIEDSSITCIAPIAAKAKGGKNPIDAYAICVDVPNGNRSVADPSPAAKVEILGNTTLNAASPAGNAYGLAYGARPPATEISGSTTFNVAAASGKNAFGIRADAAKGRVTLSGNVSASAASDITGFPSSDPFSCATDAHYAALATNGNETTYVLGSGFSATSLPVAIGTEPASMNASGSRIARFAEGYSMDDAAASAAFAPASFGPQKTMAAADGDGVYLKLDPAKAEAKVGDVLYGTFREASVAAKSGETVVVLQDLDSAPFAATAAEASASDKSALSYTVDLNGKKVGQFSCESGANVTLKSSISDQPPLTGPAGAQAGYAITHKGTGTLTVDGSVSVAVEKTTTAAQGLSSSEKGKLVANNVTVSVKSETASATGYSIIGDADISGGTVSAQSTSGYANGVSGASGSVTLSNVAVDASGAGEGARALVQMGKGSVNASGSSFTATLTGARSDGNIDAVLARGDQTSAKVGLSGCTLKAGAAEGVEAPGVGFSAVRDDGGSYQSAEFSFAGATSVTTAGIAFSGLRAPMTFADDATFAGASAENPLTVSTGADLADDVFAQLPEQASGNLASLKDSFKIAEGDRYGEWEVRATEDGKRLYFYTDAVAYIVRGDSAKYFGTLAQAVAGAEDGETVVVRRDAPATAPLAVAKDLTIDFAGFDVGISGTHPANAGLVSVADGCSLTLNDSKRDDPENGGSKKAGKLTLTVSGTSAGAYGMYVSPSANLVIDGAAVDVYCASGGPLGAGGADAEQAVVGVLVQAGATNSVSLKGSALRVHTRKSAVSADSGATSAYGIFLNGAAAAGEAPVIQVDGSSTVSVESSGLFQNAGRIVAVDEGNLSATSGLQSARLKRVYPDEDGQLYKDIAAKFKQVAKYDGESSIGGLPTGSQVYSAGIYYAAPLVVDGTAYWVFSGRVDDPGDPALIKPTAIYAQSTYQLPPTAVGIGSNMSSATGMDRDVSVYGSVSATSALGDAYAAKPGSGAAGTWSFTGAALSAESRGSSPYRAEGGKIVLNDVLDLGRSEVEFYPSSVTQMEVVDALPQAHAIADESAGKAKVVLAGRLSVTAKSVDGGASGADVVTGEVADKDDAAKKKTSPFYIGEGFALAEGGDSPLRVVGLDGENREGDEFAKASEGVTADAALRSLFEDVTGKCNVALDAEAGSLMWGGTFAVRFLDMYGNELKSYEGVKDGQEVEAPGALQMARDRDATNSYEFAGWSTDPDAQPDDAGVTPPGPDGTLAASAASAADGVVTYHPVYRQVPVTMKVIFKGAYSSDGTAIAETGGTVAAGSTMKAAKNNGTLDVPAAADYATTSGEAVIKHVFVGWTHGQSTYDADELYDMTISQNDGDEAEMTLTAKYVTCDASGQYVARFKVQRMVYAYAEQVGTSPTYAKADQTASLGYPEKPKETESGTTYAFAGWLRGYSNECVVDSPSKMTYGRTDTLPAADAGTSELFTAGFTTAKTTAEVKFYYYVQQESGSWTYVDPNFGTGNKFVCEYGSDPISLVRDKAVSFTQDGKSYTFLGWSTRYNDKEPLYTNETGLPPAGNSGLGSSATYWGIYKVEDQTADVRFVFDGGEYTADGVAYNASLADAFAATGKDKPGANSQGLRFLGWSGDEGSSEYVPDTNLVKDYVSDDGTATLYAVYSEGEKVTLDYNNGSGQSYTASVTGAGKVVLPSDWFNPSKDGAYFDGWSKSADAESADFDLATDALGAGTERLFAVYRPLSADVPSDGSVEADSSAMHVSANGAMGSGKVVLEVEEESAPDAALAGALKDGEKAVQAYSVSVNYVDSRDGDEVHLNKGFGKAVLTFGVPSELDGRPVKAIWLKADGSIGSVESAAVSTQGVGAQAAGRTVTVTLDSYADSATGGNILIASTLTAEEKQLAQTIANGVDALDFAMRAVDANDSDYAPESYAAAVAAYESGIAKVKAAKTAQEAADAANAALDAMDTVPTLSGLNAAKAEALQKLADAYSGYSKDSYTDANWEALAAAYNKAKADVRSAKSAADATKAGSDGVVAMSSVKAGGTASGDSEQGTAAGSGEAGSSDGASSSGGSSATGGSSSAGGSSIGSSGTSGLSSRTTGSAITSSGTSGLSSSAGSSAAPGLSAISEGSAGAQQVGATLQPVDDALAKEKGLSKTGGLYVSEVKAGGPAEAAGIKAGDVITAVDGKSVNSLKDLNAALSGKKAGTVVTVTAERDGVPSDYEVTLGEVADPEAAAKAEAAIAAGLTGSDGVDGKNGASGLPSDAGLGSFDWLPLVVALVVLAIIAGGLIWWLMRRRNEGLVDDGQDPEGVPALQL